jgi:hypothetical protein
MESREGAEPQPIIVIGSFFILSAQAHLRHAVFRRSFEQSEKRSGGFEKKQKAPPWRGFFLSEQIPNLLAACRDGNGR